MTHKDVQDLIKSEAVNLVNKLTARTALGVEALPSTPGDTRPAWYAEWEVLHYDNPESHLYRDAKSGYIAATLAGVDTEGNLFRLTEIYDLEVRRGAVIVLIDTPRWTWEGTSLKVGDVMVCTGENVTGKAKTAEYCDTQRFRLAESPEVFRLHLNTANARFATATEIGDFVKVALSNKPMTFIKLLGDADELSALD